MKYEAYGPGKFSDNVQEYLYQKSLDGGGDETGDVSTIGWHATLLVLTPEEQQELQQAANGYEGTASVVVMEDDQDFVTVETYPNEEEAQNAFSEYEQQYSKFGGEGDEDPHKVLGGFEDDDEDLDNEDPPRDLGAEDDYAAAEQANNEEALQALKSIHDQTHEAMELRKAGKVQDAVRLEVAVWQLIKDAKDAGYGEAAENVQLMTHSGDDWKAIEAELNDANPPDPVEREESLKEQVAAAPEIVRKPYEHQAQCSTCGREGRVYTYGLDHGDATEWLPGKFCGKNCYFGYHGQDTMKGESMDPVDPNAPRDIGYMQFGGKDKSQPPISMHLNPRPIHEIARDIRMKWPKPYFGAVPYLDAMLDLDGIHDMYMHDSAESILLYFLANAQGFRGPEAKTLKQEIKDLIASKKRTPRPSGGIRDVDRRFGTQPPPMGEAMEGNPPKTGGPCTCTPGKERDNCPNCEGTGEAIDWRAFHNDKKKPATKSEHLQEKRGMGPKKKLKGKALARFKFHKKMEATDPGSAISRVRTALRLAAANVNPQLVMEQMFSGELAKREAESLFMVVQAGDKITIAGPDGQPMAGVAIRKTDDGNGWILDPTTGGAIASKETIVAVDNPVADMGMGMDDFDGAMDDQGMDFGGDEPALPDEEEPTPSFGAGPAPLDIRGPGGGV